MSELGPGSVLAHYRLIERLGEGGMGVVWKAHDSKLGREVAIKILPERFAGEAERRAKFEREAKAVAALSHPSIVTIHSVEEDGGVFFFTMELIQGESLSKHVVKGGMALDRFLEVAIPLADAISAAHERGIIHRDLKPGNIMITTSGKVKILDFGLARYHARDVSAEPVGSDETTITDEMRLSGTISYMSPEQIRGEAVDHRSDIFSLGIVLFEIATGRRPFHGKTPADVMASILKDTPPLAGDLNPHMPHSLGLVIRHCLEKDTRRRMQSALDLRNELEQFRREDVAGESEFGPSIAVLPPTDMSPEKDQAYFCEGIAEEIINALSAVQGLRVASRSSSFRFRSGADSRTIGRRLRVGAVLEGSVRKAGNRLRISAQLVSAETGFQLWSERYDREVSDIFAIQDEIAHRIVDALRVTLTPKERGALRRVPTRDVQAYDYYLRGRRFYYQFGRRDIEFALQLFSRAIELDPNYALAYAGLADCWSYLYLYAERVATLREQAETASRRAIELAPDSAQAQASRALALSLSGRDDEAEQAFETAMRLDPNLFEAHYFYARHRFVRGQLEEAARLYEQAMRIRPEDYQAPLLVAQIYDDLGRHEDAAAARRRGIDIAEQQLAANPVDARAVYMAANGMVALGELDRGREWAERALAMGPQEPMVLYNVGCIYALLGLPDLAIDCLDNAVSHGLGQRGWYEHDSNLDSLRSHPRFHALMTRL
jgi:non-specific serine/threonine protein kinase